MKRNNWILGLLGVTVLISIGLIKNCREYYYLHQKHDTTTAIIYEAGHDSDGNLTFSYEFEFNKKKYNGSDVKFNLYGSDAPEFLNKKIVVLFSIEKPDVNTALLFKKDFDKYNIPYPDSLDWIEKMK
jgi:hypothetical protein